jgi:hypothetical protein
MYNHRVRMALDAVTEGVEPQDHVIEGAGKQPADHRREYRIANC